MTILNQNLSKLCENHPKFLNKGGLCVALVVTQAAMERGLPLIAEDLRTGEGGQVAGLGKAAVQRILEHFGITKVLAEEGGRTSRGSLGLMTVYVNLLNDLHTHGPIDWNLVFAWWIEKVKQHFASEGPKFLFDSGKSLRANIEHLLFQAREVQQHGGGTNYVGAILQHLVGAKLDMVLGVGVAVHSGFSVADAPTARQGDFQIDKVVIHVTTHPSEALIRKCSLNLQAGLVPMIITVAEGVTGAAFLLNSSSISDRVDVLDAVQFLTANVYEHSLFKTSACKQTLSNLLERYNEIVALCETDPTLRILIPER